MKKYTLIKGVIGGAIVGVIAVSSATSLVNLSNIGKLELYKTKESKVKRHKLEVVINNNGYESKYRNYVSDYNILEKHDDKSTITISEPCELTNGQIKIKNYVYSVDQFSSDDMNFLMDSLDYTDKDCEIFKGILVKTGSKLVDASYDFMLPEDYLDTYKDGKKTYTAKYYSYKNDNEDTKIETINDDELDTYYRYLDANAIIGTSLGIGSGLGIAAYAKNKKKKKIKKMTQKPYNVI